MSQPCIYKFGEFSPEEFSGEEFFIGYEDCSVSSTDIDCNNLFLHSKIACLRFVSFYFITEYVNVFFV